MPAIVTTLPRAGGNGAALVVVVADLIMGMFATAVAQAASIPSAGNFGIWRLYRLGVNGDSVSPKVLAALQGQSAG